MASPPPPDFERLIAAIASSLTAHDLPFMIIGGHAVLLHGEPRLTQDIDITLGVSPERLADVLRACEAMGLEPLPEDPDSFVRETFVLPAMDHDTGIRVDLIFSTTPYEAQAIDRAVPVEIGTERVPFATAEDLILHKLFAGRARDLDDVVGVVRRKGREIDWSYIRGWAAEFAEIPGRQDLPSQVNRLEGEARGRA